MTLDIQWDPGWGASAIEQIYFHTFYVRPLVQLFRAPNKEKGMAARERGKKVSPALSFSRLYIYSDFPFLVYELIF